MNNALDAFPDDYGYDYFNGGHSFQFYINDFSVDFLFGPVERRVVKLFHNSTVFEIQRPKTQSRQLSAQYQQIPSIEDELITVFGFKATVVEIIDRLDVLGYSLERVEKDFNSSKVARIQQMEYSESTYRLMGSTLAYDNINSSYPDQAAFQTRNLEKEFLLKWSFEDYLNAISEIIKKSLRRVIEPYKNGRRSIIPRNIENQGTRYLVCQGFQVIPFSDNLNLLSCVINSVQEGSVTYEAEGIPKKAFEEYISKSFGALKTDVHFDLKTLVLTEGKTDKEYIETALGVFYPHLTDLFFFLDFNITEGSASRLRNVTKSLVASDVPNKIIALFDNDKAGISQMEALNREIGGRMANLRVLKFPRNQKISYPVKSKNTGEIDFIDINGLGAAIETYLPEDLLKDESGSLSPLVDPCNGGQLKFGLSKKRVLEAFHKKINSEIHLPEWTDMIAILNTIKNAFSK